MKRVIRLSGLLTVVLAVFAYAGDFWEKKPYQDWTDKEVERILTNSPWAKEVSAFVNARGAPGGSGGSASRGGRMGRGGGGGEMGGPGDEMGPGAPGGMGGGGRGGMGGGGGAWGGPGSSGAQADRPSVTALLRWHSALPVKQAYVKSRFGPEAASSAEAKGILSRQESHYVVVLDNLPGMMPRTDPARWREGLKAATSLARKGKDALRPDDVQFRPRDKFVMIFFVFPRNAPITLEDKEVEFSTRLGPLEFKRKFKLHDMVIDGKLEL